MLANTTSGTCPTPGKDPDFLLASFCNGAVEEQQQESDWCSDFRAAIGHPVSNHIPEKIEEAGVFGLTHLTEHSTLNTPTMETVSYGFDLATAAAPTTLDNEELFNNVWGFGGGASSPDLVAVPPRLVDGGANMELDEGFCPSPDSAPLLSQLAAPTPPSEILPDVNGMATYVEPKVENPSTCDDLLSWIADDIFMPTSEMPGEVKEEEEEVQVPTTLDTSQLFMHIPTPQQDFNRPVAQPATSIVAEKPSRPSTTKRRGRGRPPVPLGRTITPRLPRRRITSGEESDYSTAVYYSTDEGSLTEAEAEKQKYRRMRDLNNEASKRCRENRKSKFSQLEEQRDTLMVRNQALRKRLSTLEANVRKLKTFYLEHLAAGRELPRPELMWSMLDMNPNEF